MRAKVEERVGELVVVLDRAAAAAAGIEGGTEVEVIATETREERIRRLSGEIRDDHASTFEKLAD